MPKSSKKRSPKSTAARATTAKAPTISDLEKKNDAGSKQARVIEMLQSPTGMTIAAMMTLIYLTYFNAGPACLQYQGPAAARGKRLVHPAATKVTCRRSAARPRDPDGGRPPRYARLHLRNRQAVGSLDPALHRPRINPRRLINDDARQHAFLAGDDAKPVVLDFMKRERGENAPADLRDLN
jgi:hypothetical protein